MNASQISQQEIIARLQEICEEQERLAVEATGLLTQMRKPKWESVKPVPLMFGKNVITWGNGQALAIKGKAYEFVKALYEADKMRLKEETLDRLIWKDKIKHSNFKVFVRRLSEKLEKAKFPYRLKPVVSKPKVKETAKKLKSGSPVKIFVPPEIIGVKLHATKTCPSVSGKQ